MKKETQGKVKKTAATAASAVAGAATGVFLGGAISAEAAEQQEQIEPKAAEEQPAHTQPVAHPATHASAPQPNVVEIHVDPVIVTGPVDGVIPPDDILVEPTVDPTVDPLPPEPLPLVPDEIEVLSYERIPTMEGGEMDVAVLDVNGTEVAVVDFNLDGTADSMAADFNQNGVIDEGESMDILDQGISMTPFQEEAGFQPEYPDLADNNLPDYMNDANVDNYMA